MTADGSARRLHLWSGLIVLGVFLAGAAAGAGLHAWIRPARPYPPPPPPGHALVPHLAELQLSTEQQQRARAVMEKYRPKLEAVIRESFPRVRAVQEQIDAEIAALLTEPQKKKFDELRARRPPFPPRPPPGDGRPGAEFPPRPPPDGLPGGPPPTDGPPPPPPP